MNKLNKLFTLTIVLIVLFFAVFPVYNCSAENKIVNPSTNNTDNIVNPSTNTTDPNTNQTNKSSSAIIPLQNPLSNKFNSVGGLINGFMEIFAYLVVILAVLALIWVGLQFILAQGNSDRISELKTWLYYIVIGVAVVIGARLIVSVVINTLESAGSISPNVIQKANQAINNQ